MFIHQFLVGTNPQKQRMGTSHDLKLPIVRPASWANESTEPFDGKDAAGRDVHVSPAPWITLESGMLWLATQTWDYW